MGCPCAAGPQAAGQYMAMAPQQNGLYGATGLPLDGQIAAHSEELTLRFQPRGGQFYPGGTWEHLHTVIRDAYWTASRENMAYGSFSFAVPAPFDRPVTDDNIAWWWDQALDRLGLRGGLLLVALWSRADRIAGVPYMWHYHCAVIYYEPGAASAWAAAALPAFGALLGAFAEIAIIAIALGITFRIIGTGDFKEIISAPFTGIAGILVLGIVMFGVAGIVFPQLQARAGARLGPVTTEVGTRGGGTRRR